MILCTIFTRSRFVVMVCNNGCFTIDTDCIYLRHRHCRWLCHKYAHPLCNHRRLCLRVLDDQGVLTLHCK
ncbi:hypothetical protein PISMIDRAFT_342920 [Pisolithus microcarpus 441]|uniref:Uncharacterized protein n=1 Tax=Pisolithus microcarpus 441 TaxID=765257 RepID=A0A0C9YXI9_9AGAM|nr:hypothetical protein PISMIDRAFT_342920 [Pisolithus microcarpus 441]